MKKFYVILCAMLFLGLTTTVFAAPPDAPAGQDSPQVAEKHHPQHFDRNDRMHGHGSMEFQEHPIGFRFSHHLKLTPEQSEKMKEVRNRFWSDTHDLKYDLDIKKLELEKLFTDPKTDNATLLAKEKELNALRLKLMDKMAEMKIEWRKVLTPEQIRMLSGMHHHRGHMAGAGPMREHTDR